MRHHTASIAIDAPPAAAFAFLADATKLPVWAIGFAKAVAPAGDGAWLVTLSSGDTAPLRIEADAATGVVDYVSDAPAHSRVLPHGPGTLYTFSMHKPPGMPDEVFDAQVAELGRELTVLKAHLESACPL